MRRGRAVQCNSSPAFWKEFSHHWQIGLEPSRSCWAVHVTGKGLKHLYYGCLLVQQAAVVGAGQFSYKLACRWDRSRTWISGAINTDDVKLASQQFPSNMIPRRRPGWRNLRVPKAQLWIWIPCWLEKTITWWQNESAYKLMIRFTICMVHDSQCDCHETEHAWCLLRCLGWHRIFEQHLIYMHRKSRF
jgi:hypothetical protein